MLDHQPLTLTIMIATVCLSAILYYYVPKGLFPQQDTGLLSGSIQAAQDISFDAMRAKQKQFADIVTSDPAVQSNIAFVGGGNALNTGRMYILLKPLSEREIRRGPGDRRACARKLAVVSGATLFLQANQDIRVGARQSNSQYQYTLESENLSDLNAWAPHHGGQAFKTLPELRDVSTDQQEQGLAGATW